jgi:hypothetical protein
VGRRPSVAGGLLPRSSSSRATGAGLSGTGPGGVGDGRASSRAWATGGLTHPRGPGAGGHKGPGYPVRARGRRLTPHPPGELLEADTLDGTSAGELCRPILGGRRIAMPAGLIRYGLRAAAARRGSSSGRTGGRGTGPPAGDGPVLPYPHPRARSACRWHHARDTAGSSVHPSTVHRGPGRRRPGTVAPTPCARARRTPWEAAHPRPVSDLRADFLRGTSRPRRRFGRRVTWTPPPPAGGYAAGQSPAGRPGTGAGHSGRCRCSRRRRGARGCTSLAGY